MKQTVQMNKIQEKMKPGVITLQGFLGKDERNLTEILLSDDEEVKRKGWNHTKIAERMIYLKESGVAGLGDFVEVPPHFEVKVDSVRGKLPCPFGDPGIFPKTNITVRNLNLNREITYTDLNIHFIGSHGFYQGLGSPFRLEPAELVEVLEIETGEETGI